MMYLSVIHCICSIYDVSCNPWPWGVATNWRCLLELSLALIHVLSYTYDLCPQLLCTSYMRGARYVIRAYKRRSAYGSSDLWFVVWKVATKALPNEFQPFDFSQESP